MKGLSFCTALLLMSMTTNAQQRTAFTGKYPDTKMTDQTDDYFGTKVSDPYRWLEDDVRESKDVAAWVEAENKVTFGYLESIPQRESIRKRLTELVDIFDRFSK